MSSEIKIDTRAFGRELERYMTVSKKEAQDVLNTKVFFITLGALKATPAAEGSQIERDLNALVASGAARSKTGQFRRRVKRIYLLVNARRRKQGKPGLYGAAMAAAVSRTMGARIRSKKFLASGWLPALRDVGKVVEAAQLYRAGKSAGRNSDIQVVGHDKGSGSPADLQTQGWNLTATIVNSARVQGKNAPIAMARMEAALQESIDTEVASMVEYFDKKMQQRANEFKS